MNSKFGSLPSSSEIVTRVAWMSAVVAGLLPKKNMYSSTKLDISASFSIRHMQPKHRKAFVQKTLNHRAMSKVFCIQPTPTTTVSNEIIQEFLGILPQELLDRAGSLPGIHSQPAKVLKVGHVQPVDHL